VDLHFEWLILNTVWKWLAHNTTFDRGSDCSILTSSHYRYTEPVSASSVLKQLLHSSVLQVMKFATISCSQNQCLGCGFLFHFISCFINYTDYLILASFPGPRRGEEKGLVSTVCTCA